MGAWRNRYPIRRPRVYLSGTQNFTSSFFFSMWRPQQLGTTPSGRLRSVAVRDAVEALTEFEAVVQRYAA
jgi:hypothetical protein